MTPQDIVQKWPELFDTPGQVLIYNAGMWWIKRKNGVVKTYEFLALALIRVKLEDALIEKGYTVSNGPDGPSVQDVDGICIALDYEPEDIIETLAEAYGKVGG